MNRLTRMRRLGCGALVLASLVGCADEPRAVSDTAAEELQPRVAEIRALAGARQPEQVTAELAELRLVVEDLQRRDELSEQGAQEVLAAADAVAAQLGLITTTTTQPPTTQPAPPPPPPPPPPAGGGGNDDEGDRDEREDEGDDRGNGGDGRGDGGNGGGGRGD